MIRPLENWGALKRGYAFGEKTYYSARHLGSDLVVPEGTPVLAPCKLKIVFSGWGKDGGNTIHAEIFSKRYGKTVMRCLHLKERAPRGSYAEGAIIGRTGNTGALSRGPHLHIDISRGKVRLRQFENFIDPEEFFSNV